MHIHEGGDVGVIDDDGENFTVDFGSVADAVREVIPKGDYNVVIASLDFQMSQSSNKPMWAIQLEIEDGQFAGRKIYTNLSFSEKALSMTKGVIKILKPELLDSPLNPKKIADSGDLLGLKAKVKTKLELYEGEKQTRVARWMPSPQAANAFA